MNRFLWQYVLPISLGSSLYALCRPTTILYERIFHFFVGASWLSMKRHFNYSCRSTFGDDFTYDLIVYSLPNALWHVSLCYLLSFGIKSFWGIKSIAWRLRIVLFLLVALTPDFLQSLGLIPGTFDIFDVILASLASCLAWAVTWKWCDCLGHFGLW